MERYGKTRRRLRRQRPFRDLTYAELLERCEELGIVGIEVRKPTRDELEELLLLH